MDFDRQSLHRRLDRLRRTLPASGHPRSALLAELRARGAAGRAAPRLSVIDIFDAGQEGGLMCRFFVADQGARSFVAPLSHIAFDRRHPLARAGATGAA
jgi:hypothetical protein